ncbi:MAG: helix-turn-helix domain-containing protein [Desulfobacterales bacterium]|nr:helix-turn-helix domain-containing protein [Desulfobacterales bacterium]
MVEWKDKAAHQASKFINGTGCHVFLTGRAGTGKTTFLHDIRRRTHKNTIVAAPTGIAAINAEGVTLHSLFQLPFGAFIPEDRPPGDGAPDFELNTPRSLRRNLKMHTTKRNMLRKLELLIIDEVSMLRADLLDAIDSVLRMVRRRPDAAFGGVQVLFIGDLQQLPPVVKDSEWQVLKEFYETMFFFGARALAQNSPVYIELSHIYRQSDETFISVLNHLRDGRLTDADIECLNRCCRPGFAPDADDGYVFLTTHNRKADRINQAELEKLPGKLFEYSARVKGKFDARTYPVEPVLALKKGAQVMFIKNDPTGEQRFYNGRIGTVEELDPDGIKVGFGGQSPSVWVEPHTWENKRYTLNKETNEIAEKTVGTFVHYPLKLAWAITIHKSQGLTFDRAVIDVAQAFAAGQTYVALSRLTALEGLVLTSPFHVREMARDPALEAFAKQKTDPKDLEPALAGASLDYLARTVRDAFDFSGLVREMDFHVRTYTKDAAHSKKQAYLDWARSLQADLRPVREVGDRFLKQLDAILAPELDLDHLSQRVDAAKGYFAPILKGFCERISAHLAELKTQKTGLKKYITEIETIDQLFSGRMQEIEKAAVLIDSFAGGKELTRADLPGTGAEKTEAGPASGTAAAREKKEKKPSTKKTGTKTASLQLFNQGKTIGEIARERSLNPRTIQGHLAYWIEQGEIAATDLVAKEDLNEILSAIRQLETPYLKPVYEFFSGRYDYPAIQFAMACFRHRTNGDSGGN